MSRSTRWLLAHIHTECKLFPPHFKCSLSIIIVTASTHTHTHTHTHICCTLALVIPGVSHHIGFNTQSVPFFNNTECFLCDSASSVLHWLAHWKNRSSSFSSTHYEPLPGPPAYLTGPSIIKLIGVADLRSSAPAMAPLVAVNDKLTDSPGFNPNYTWLTRAKTWHL